MTSTRSGRGRSSVALSRRAFVGGTLSTTLGAGCRHEPLGAHAPSNAPAPDPERLTPVPVTAPAPALPVSSPFVQVQGTRFMRAGQPYYMTGFNYWAAVADSRTDEGRARVRRELSRLRAMGVSALRIMALSEGPDTEPWRIRPSLQPAAGRFSVDGLAGLEWLMRELSEQGLLGVFTLNNFWFWSGGMAQYVSWANATRIPYPNPNGGGDWDAFQRFSARFFSDHKAQALFRQALERVITPYRDSPAVLAWELANEPRPREDASLYRRWVDETARFIKSIDPNHLITTGSEGDTASPGVNGLDITRDHMSSAIDFVSFHVWPENWGWFQPSQPERDFAQMSQKALAYIEDQVRKSAALGKPALLLETGLGRDQGSFEPHAPVALRDRYLELVFELTLRSVEACGPLAGAFPWAWSGEGLPDTPGIPGQQRAFTGDPPHERQGWYSIYAHDESTTSLITRWAARILAAARTCNRA